MSLIAETILQIRPSAGPRHDSHAMMQRLATEEGRQHPHEDGTDDDDNRARVNEGAGDGEDDDGVSSGSDESFSLWSCRGFI